MIEARAVLVKPSAAPAEFGPEERRAIGPLLSEPRWEEPTVGPFSCLSATGLIDPGDGPRLRADLRAYGERSGADTAFLWGPLATQAPGLLVLDVDSTLITAEVIELLAAHAGKQQEVAAITERAMRGELDFAASLEARVAVLAGLPATVLDDVRRVLQPSPGAAELIDSVRGHSGSVGVVSGGFIEIVAPLANGLGIDFVQANRLEICDGLLTGRTVGPVVDRATKRRFLLETARRLGLVPQQVAAIGDGANDLDMLDVAGLGIAYCAKPVTRAAADTAISFPRLDVARAFLRLS